MNTELSNPILNKLIQLGRPNTEINYIKKLGLTTQHWEVLTQITTDTSEVLYNSEDENKFYATIHAGCALFQLDKLAAVPVLLSQLYKSDVYDDDWIDEYLNLISSVGVDILALIYAAIEENNQKNYNSAVNHLIDVLGRIALQHSQMQTEIIAYVESLLKNYPTQAAGTNALLIGVLVDCKSVDSIDLIRQAFAADQVDLRYMGDVENVEIELGLRTTRDTPQVNYLWQELTRGLSETQQKEFPANLDRFKQAIMSPNQSASPNLAKIPVMIQRSEEKVGRNEPCPCGSGKKYKKCCLV